MDLPNAVKEFLPLLAGFIFLVLVKSEYAITAAVIVLLLISFKMSYAPGELTLFFVGVVFGFLLEYLGNAFYQLQYWEGANILSFPIWLPLFWGYIVVLARRIGNDIVQK